MTTEPLHTLLRHNALFANLPDSLLEQLEPGLELTELSSGETLVRQGDPGDALFVLVAGQLQVFVRSEAGSEVQVDSLEPGASVGEMALVAGHERSATVRAITDARLVRLSRQDFARLAQQNPGLRQAIIRQIEPRLQRIQLGAVLEEWFPEITPAELQDLQESVAWLRLSGGETLYEQGDAADGMYLLVSGRLRVLPHGSEIGRGSSIGEFAVLGDAPRTETVMALRDSLVVRLDRQLVARQPQVMSQIARNALARAAGVTRTVNSGVRSIALVPAHAGAPVAKVARLLVKDVKETAEVLDAGKVDSYFGSDGAAQTAPGDDLEPALLHWLNEIEARNERIVLVTDPTMSAWTRRCLGQADQVIVVAEASGDPQPGPLEQELAELVKGSIQLLLVHPDDAIQPTGTAQWLDARAPLVHHHLRLGHKGDAGRLVRRLTGTAIGLTLSGGGARGYVHMGLIRALEELGVPVDMVIGTSMGALVAGVYAHTLTFDGCYRNAARFGDPKMLLDKTLPLVALAESRNVTEALKSMFADTQIEDQWIPFACVAANLTQAEPVIFERGPMWQAVRASTAIPGIFTPITLNGDVLVDGGIVNNYPVDIMRERIGSGLVIGSNAENSARNRAFAFGPSLSGWRLLLDRFRPQHKRVRYPSILSTLMRSTSISAKYLGAAADALTDIGIRYPVQDFGNLEFQRYQELSEIGYETALPLLAAWQAGHPSAEAHRIVQ